MSDHLHASTLGVDFNLSISPSFTAATSAFGRLLSAHGDRVVDAWRRHLTQRACRAAERYLKGFDDEALSALGLRRTEIPSAVRQLEVALLGCAAGATNAHGDTP